MELVTVLLTRSRSSKETTLAEDTVGTEAETVDGYLPGQGPYRARAPSNCTWSSYKGQTKPVPDARVPRAYRGSKPASSDVLSRTS